MSQKAPRVPHRNRAGSATGDRTAEAAAPAPAEDAAPRAEPKVEPEATTDAIPVVGSPGRTTGARTSTPRPGRSARGEKPGRKGGPGSRSGGARARSAQRAQDRAPENRKRRLRERLALEGSIRDPGGSGPLPPQPNRAGPDRPTPARALSSRVITLTVILIVSGFMLFPAVTTFVRQQNELHATHAELDEQKQTQQRLDDELKRWDDPDYVRQQARERIGMAVPGEKQYLSKGPHSSRGTENTTAKPGEYRQGLPWGDGLWDSVLRSSKP